MIPTRVVMLPIVEDGKVLGEMPFALSEQCATCSHWKANLQCDAFPDLIPEAIRSGRHDHRLPFEGDGGVRYDPIPAVARSIRARKDVGDYLGAKLDGEG